jgi:serine/threonine protein kinase
MEIKILGNGLSGTVYLESGNAKKIYSNATKCKHEINILQQINNARNIIQMKSYNINEKYIILEYVPKLLEDVIISCVLTRDQQLNIINQLQDFLKDIHNLGYVHGDFKAKNILITNDLNQIKVIDFDLTSKSTNSKVDYDKLKFIIIQLYWGVSYEHSWKNYKKLYSSIADQAIRKLIDDIIIES